jgi:putative ABC transport system permease protein
MATPVISSFFDTLALSVVFALIALNVYLSSFVMKITDITCDGSVAIGGCAYGVLVIVGINPVIAFVVATGFGVVAGMITSAVSTLIRVEPILSSIITLTAIQTFSTKLSNIGNLYTARSDKAISSLNFIDNCIIVCCVVAIIGLIFYRFMNSEQGLAMRVFGNGRIVSESLGISCDGMMSLGLGLGNGLSAAAGALLTQITGFFSASMGEGAFVFGMAAVFLGEKIISPTSISSSIVGCFIGSIVCRMAVALCTLDAPRSVLRSDYDGIMIALMLIFLMASIADGRKGRMENF